MNKGVALLAGSVVIVLLATGGSDNDVIVLCLFMFSGRSRKTCEYVGNSAGDDTWCEVGCNNNPPVCPADECQCTESEEPQFQGE